MKYESSILKRLIDTYGVVGNPCYISEIIKEFIVRGKERFPELFTYQSDWLAHIDEFGLNPTYTVSYTGQSIYAPNTLERPVKRAILKGSTKYRDIDTGEFLETFEEGRNLELVSVKMPVLTTTGKNLFDVRSIDNAEYDGAYRYVKIPIKRNTTYTLSLDKTLSFGYVNIAYGTTPWGGGGFEWVCHPEVAQKDVMTFTNTIYDFLYINWAENNEDLPGEKYVGVFRTIQLEEGTQATPYEPYKSNILTVNEEVELRGVGVVQDELNLLTSEMTERIGEVVLDGRNNYTWEIISNDTKTIRFQSRNIPIPPHIYSYTLPNILCDKLKVVVNDDWRVDREQIEIGANPGQYEVNIRIAKAKLSGETVGALKNYLQANPITIQYELATPIVKTVELTTLDQNGQNVKQLMSFNGGTHFTTTSQDGSLLPTLTVDVVTDLEETLMVCSLEGNTI